MKMALASVIMDSASAAAVRNKIRKISEVLRKFSLNAAKNWHQNNGAKRLDSIRGGGMAPIIAKFQPRVAPYRQQNGRPKGRPRRLASDRTHKRNYRRNLPPLAESTTIAAMLSAMAIVKV